METEKNDQADLGGTAKEFSSIKCREKEKKKKVTSQGCLSLLGEQLAP